MGRTACAEPQCLYSTAIPLFPLWAVRPVQSLSACTVELYLYSPYGPYGLYRASVSVQVCTVPFTFIAFPLQQWLRERPTVLRHTYIACPVYEFCLIVIFAFIFDGLMTEEASFLKPISNSSASF